MGVVTQITETLTFLRTRSNGEVILHHRRVFEHAVINHSSAGERSFEFCLKGDVDIDRAEAVVLAILSGDRRIASSTNLLVSKIDQQSVSLVIECRVQMFDAHQVRSDVMRAAKKQLEATGIGFSSITERSVVEK